MDVQSVEVELFFALIIGIIFWPSADTHADPLLANQP
jgi:hypothetical protein